MWLDVGREFVVELLLLSRDGDVIPIGGGGGPVALLNFLDGQLRCVGARVSGARGGMGGAGRGVEGGGGGGERYAFYGCNWVGDGWRGGWRRKRV